MSDRSKRLRLNLGGVVLDDICCINLKRRKDRKIKFKRQMKKKNVPFRLFYAEEDKKYPERGKFRAHLTIIKQAKIRKCKSVLILEDDARILTPNISMPPAPKNWEMIYFGGNIQTVLEDDDTNKSNNWKRICCLMSHAYIVNESMYGELLSKGYDILQNWKTNPIPYDRWLCTQIHPKHNVFILTPDRIIQRDGFSDIQKKEITYNQQKTTFCESKQVSNQEGGTRLIDKVEQEMIGDQDPNTGEIIHYSRLKLAKIDDKDLPKITLLTPTRNNKEMFYFAVSCFFKLDYPKDKLTWIIADDGDNDQKVRELIPPDKRIKYINCTPGPGGFLAISKKLNVCMSYVANDCQYIMHFFDNMYYPPLSAATRIRTLLAYPEKDCLGCTEFGVFDYTQNKSYQMFYPDYEGRKTILYCPSLTFKKSFWEERKFDEDQYTFESFFFIKNRYHKLIQMPYNFILFSLTQQGDSFRYQKINNNNNKNNKNNNKQNSVVNSAKYTKRSEDGNDDFKNFYDTWSLDIQNFMLVLNETC